MKISRDGLLLVGCVFFFALDAPAKDQEFRLEKPGAQSVALAGEFNSWKAQAMTKGHDGVWTATLSLSPGTYGYKFFVNRTDWTFDPKNPNRKTVDGIENSAIEISDGGSGSGLPTPQSTATPFAPPVPTPESSVRGKTAALAPTSGEILTLDVSLSQKRRAEAAKDGNARLAHAKMAIAVPQNFDPQKPWPVLIISNTEAYSNIDSMRQFKQAAVDEGWVILAADAVEAEKNKEGSLVGPPSPPRSIISPRAGRRQKIGRSRPAACPVAEKIQLSLPPISPANIIALSACS